MSYKQTLCKKYCRINAQSLMNKRKHLKNNYLNSSGAKVLRYLRQLAHV